MSISTLGIEHQTSHLTQQLAELEAEEFNFLTRCSYLFSANKYYQNTTFLHHP